jgi:hypothetical protein
MEYKKHREKKGKFAFSAIYSSKFLIMEIFKACDCMTLNLTLLEFFPLKGSNVIQFFFFFFNMAHTLCLKKAKVILFDKTEFKGLTNPKIAPEAPTAGCLQNQ